MRVKRGFERNKNAEFLRMDAAKAASMLKNRGEHPDAVVIDPPRKGCDPEPD